MESPTSVGGFRYYRASADGQITVEAANRILGPWTRIGDLSHLGISNGATGGTVVEAAMWMPFNGRAEWVLWLDRFKTGRGYLPLGSTNLGSTRNFHRLTGYSLDTTRKLHGGIISLTASEESRVPARWNRTGDRCQQFPTAQCSARHF